MKTVLKRQKWASVMVCFMFVAMMPPVFSSSSDRVDDWGCGDLYLKSFEVNSIWDIASERDRELYWRQMNLYLNERGINSISSAINRWLTHSSIEKHFFVSYGLDSELLVKLLAEDLGRDNTSAASIAFYDDGLKGLPGKLARCVRGMGEFEVIKLESAKMKEAIIAYNKVAELWFDTSLKRCCKNIVDYNVPGVTSPYDYSKTREEVEKVFTAFKGIVPQFLGRSRGQDSVIQALERKISAMERDGLALSEESLKLLSVTEGAFKCAKIVSQILEYIISENPRKETLTDGEDLLMIACNLGKGAAAGAAAGAPCGGVGALPGALIGTLGSVFYNLYDESRLKKLKSKIRKIQAEVCFLQLLVSCYNVGFKSVKELLEEIKEIRSEHTTAMMGTLVTQSAEQDAINDRLLGENRELTQRNNEAIAAAAVANIRAAQADNRAAAANNRAVAADNRAAAAEVNLAQTNGELERTRQEAEQRAIRDRGRFAAEQVASRVRERNLRQEGEQALGALRAERAQREAELRQELERRLDDMEAHMVDDLMNRLLAGHQELLAGGQGVIAQQ